MEGIVKGYSGSNNITLFWEKSEKTGKGDKYIIIKRILDVSKAPYMASGDGKTLNTNVLQRAIDDCRAGDAV